jgi:hypothetical protein
MAVTTPSPRNTLPGSCSCAYAISSDPYSSPASDRCPPPTVSIPLAPNVDAKKPSVAQAHFTGASNLPNLRDVAATLKADPQKDIFLGSNSGPMRGSDFGQGRRCDHADTMAAVHSTSEEPSRSRHRGFVPTTVLRVAILSEITIPLREPSPPPCDERR